MHAEDVVQTVENLGDAQFQRLADIDGEVLPEFAQQIFPVEFAGRDLV
jgi:5-methylthioribose kinase